MTTRVLHLGAGNLFGGIEVNLLTLARFRDACPDMRTEFGFCFDGKAAAELRQLGCAAHLFGAARLSRPWTVLAARRRLRQLLAGTSYDAVVCHETWVHTLFAPEVHRLGIPLVFWAHDRHTGAGGWLKRLARRQRPDRVVCNSRYSAETMPAFFPGVPCTVIYCPVAPPPRPAAEGSRAEFRRRCDTAEGAVVIVQVGRWEPHKGHLAHVEALGRLRDVPGWVCWQVGAPQQPPERAYQEEVVAAAHKNGVAERVRFLGWQPDLGAVLAAADIYCQPNVRPEPFGITLVEALYAGLPVVASAEAGPLEIVTPDCGALAPPGDVPALSRALGDLVSDPARRGRLGERGPARAGALCDPTQQIRLLAEWLSGGRRASPDAAAGSRPARANSMTAT
jgi:glycosyltransferase involved in cell wall biosynthesis